LFNYVIKLKSKKLEGLYMYPNLVGELIGTMVLVIFGDGVVANLVLKDSKGNGAGWIHVSWGWAFSVMFGIYAAWAFGAPQGDLNPAVTLFKGFAGVYPAGQVIATIIAEMIGGVIGGVIVYLLYLTHWAPTEDPTSKLAVFSTVPARRNLPCNVLTELIATVLLILGIQAIFRGTDLTAGAANSVPTFMVPFLVACLIFILGAACGGPTGYALNPARDMGPRIAHAFLPIPGKGPSDWQYGLCVPTAGTLAAAVVSYAIWAAAGFIK
jgi:glycerol uptake facilitator protein